MAACAVRRPARVLSVLILSLLKLTSAGSFAPSTDTALPGGTYLAFSGTTDSEETTGSQRSQTASTVELTSTGVDLLSTAKLSETHPGFTEREGRTATDQNTFSTDTESWTTHTGPEVSTELLSSSTELSATTVTEWGAPPIVANITNATPDLGTEQQPATATEARTVRDLTVTVLTEEDNTDTNTTESVSQTDSTYISTTISQRTLLSLTSNSTTPYTEESISSERAPNTDVTQGKEYTEGSLSTEADHTSATSENQLTTKTVQVTVSEPEVPHVSEGTQSQTGQPNVTGPGFEMTSNGGSHNATLPATVVITSGSETDTTADSYTSRTSYTETSDSAPSVTPFVTREDTNRTNVSHQDMETMTTETPAGSVSTVVGKKPESPQTHMDETTILGLTTALPSLTTVDDSLSKSLSSQQPFVVTHYPSEATEVLTTTAGPVTHRPQHTEEDTHVASTVASNMGTTDVTTTAASTITSTSAPFTTNQLQPSTTDKPHTPHVTLPPIETTQVLTTATTEQHRPTSKTVIPSLSPSSSQPEHISTDVSTLHLETSTATPGNTTARSRHTTASYSTSAPTKSPAVVTTEKSTEEGTTQTEATTMQISVKSTPIPGHRCGPQTCANGGRCVQGDKCECLPAWKGANCTEDVDECVSSPCPKESTCVNTRGSFSCKCPLGYDLEDGHSCTQAKTFLGTFKVTSCSTGLHELHKEILHLLNASLSILHGYRRSTLDNAGECKISARNMFSMSANVTRPDVYRRITDFLTNCNKQHCILEKLQYSEESLCQQGYNKCDTQSSVCNDMNGTEFCQCREGYFKKNPEDKTCRDCGDGFELVNETCVECTFGFGGFNCNNFYGLIAKVVSPAAGGLLLIVIIALLIVCCRKDKNDINKIIFKSGDLQMSPYADFPKSSRVSMEWGRETIEMQENGSTKNLLQMTDIYYSPALRNADLERNGLYPFSGLPGSRHSCIYPAQWNPSFISDDSRRRDYF
ncbi:hypothetical protein NFI96_025472 [Prochilodus magdalenae]|nr:hypothetical protein NFI96_025472 [Prochilodus magdalenae]